MCGRSAGNMGMGIGFTVTWRRASANLFCVACSSLSSMRFPLGHPFDRTRRKRVIVRRESIAQDGFDQLSSIGAGLKGPVEIQFVDQFGQEE